MSQLAVPTTHTVDHPHSASSSQSNPSTRTSPTAPPPHSEGLVLPLFMITIFLSSTLVFSVQPMFAKMVLPLLGGSPGVWNTAMLFFQIMLLLGYIYAHLTTKLLGVRWQAWLHVVIMAAVLLNLPISVANGWAPPAEGAPVPWLIGLFAVSVGLPFFAVATNAPLLQRWFSHTGHSAATDPYFLYGASNLGSILALLSYPLLIEPFLKSHDQSLVWTGSYTILVGLIMACGITLWRRYRPESLSVASPPQVTAEFEVAWSHRLHWLVLALVPSSLLLGVTMHITTDVAAVPLLWVLPLMLYLLTFVFVFARRSILPHSWMVLVHPFFLVLMALSFQWISMQAAASFTLHILVFFVTTMVCHGELVKRRPGPRHLTEFYLWMSLGGMLGGVFNVIIAPVLFNSVFEYPLMLVLACLLRPRQPQTASFLNGQDILFPGLLLAIFGIPLLMGNHPSDWGILGISVFFTVMGLVTYSFRLRPLRFGLGIATVLILTALSGTHNQVLIKERSFFGVNTVQRTEAGDFNLLLHGNTIHGAQHTDPDRWKEPLTYFHKNGPLGQIFASLNKTDTLKRVGVLGLGTGTLVCYRQPNQEWTYYEIDPSVVRLAQDTRFFRYLSACGGDTQVVQGDGRLSLATVPDGHFDFIIADAFSSDSVPMHLITREALDLYLQKLANGGLIAFNISNRNLELAGVMANLATDAQLVGRLQRYHDVSQEQKANFLFASDWVIMARQVEDLMIFDEDTRWTPLVPNPSSRVWTDNFSNIVGVLKILND